ncbi:MAG: tRNA (guanosine(37)-N1)-methyltransferase TrmD [Legionellales bacterium]|nr:tRNA (guanosine(37)-N1)-methyltransferase TrmD [Legionellales bacterium]
MWIGIISLFPEMFEPLNYGIPRKAKTDNLYDLAFINPRTFTEDRHNTVDDRTYGGGPGMVMMAEPLFQAVNHAKEIAPAKPKVIYVSPQGQKLTQEKLFSLRENKSLVFMNGRYEGVDERIIDTVVDEEISIGDYILSGGELATMVIIDALVRILPGALGHQASAVEDSFTENLLDCPHYTRPDTWRNQPVPGVLLSGDHAAIARWRKQQALGRTWLRRPDLLANYPLSSSDSFLLEQFKQAYMSRSKE